MTELIVLVDPNDKNTSELIKEVNRTQPKNLWVGCSTSPGKKITETLDKLEIRASLYPANIEQITSAKDRAYNFFVPIPLIYSKPGIEEKILEIARFFDSNNLLTHTNFMHYAVLNPNSTAARILGVDKEANDDEIFHAIIDSGFVQPYIYIESGSRNTAQPVSQRKELIKKIRTKYKNMKIIAGGGISEPSQAEELKGSADYVVVSNAVHKKPSELRKYTALFE